MKVLDLSSNLLDRLPEEMASMQSLEHLNLADNSLKALPAAFRLLTALTKLDLSNNQLQSFTTHLGRFKKLKTVNLSCNCLKVKPYICTRAHAAPRQWFKTKCANSCMCAHARAFMLCMYTFHSLFVRLRATLYANHATAWRILGTSYLRL